jgi:hypothetical protein
MQSQNFTQAGCRRLEERKQVTLPALIDSEGVRTLAVMQDISVFGARLFVKQPFPVGAHILVVLSAEIRRNCVVRRCRPIPNSPKFEIGVEVIEAGWPETVVPLDEE